jgi:localization factor PodJL
MTSGAPWSVKGIDPKAREVAKELAARAGMTLGEWLNRSILEGEAPQPSAGRGPVGHASSAVVAPGAQDPFDRPEPELRRLTDVLDRLADRLDGSEARTGQAISTLETTVRASLGRLEQAAARPPTAPPSPTRADRYEGVLRALESALSRLSAQMQEGEARTRDALEGVRSRLDRAEARTAAPGPGIDQMSIRVGEIQDRTASAMATLREAFQGLDQRLARLEATAGEGVENRLREVSFRLGERLDAAREEMSREISETSGRRISELERAFAELSQKVERVEQDVAGRSPAAAPITEADPVRRPAEEAERISEILQSRLSRADSGQAATLARLGDEIARIGDRLGARAEPDRPPASEPAPAAPVGWSLPGGGDISRRIRQSEDRTARLLEEARLRLDAHFPPSRASAAVPEPLETERDRILSLFDDEDGALDTPDALDARDDTPDSDFGDRRGEDWPLGLLAEARAANARGAPDATDLAFGDSDAQPLPGFDLSPPRPALKPRRFAGPGLASLAVFCVSASLVGFGVLSLFDKGAEDGSLPGASRTEPGVLASTPKPPGAAPPQPAAVRAAVALAPAPVVGQAGTQAPEAVPAARSSLEARFRKAQSDLAAGRPGAAAEVQALAAAGHGPAMRVLSGLHNKGEAGLAKDPALARSWLRRAAETGDRVAMHGYGLELMNGANGPRDPAAAVGWIRRAAEAGLVGSQFNLGAVYERGMGVPQDLRQAFVWYSRAAESGDGEALRQVERLKPLLSAAAAKSPEDIRLAQRALGRLGYYSGPADGAASPQLRSAIEAYQKDQKAPATGLLDDATLRRLAMLGR